MSAKTEFKIHTPMYTLVHAPCITGTLYKKLIMVNVLGEGK